MRLHRALIGIVAKGDRLTVAFPTPQSVQRAFGEGGQLAIDRDPLAGIFDIAGFGLFPLDQVELAGRRAGDKGSSHGSILRLRRRAQPFQANLPVLQALVEPLSRSMMASSALSSCCAAGSIVP